MEKSFFDLRESMSIKEGQVQDLKKIEAIDGIEHASKQPKNQIFIKCKERMTDALYAKIDAAGYFIQHAVKGVSGKDFFLSPKKDAKKWGVTLDGNKLDKIPVKEEVELEETKDTGKLMVSKVNKLIARWKKEGKTDDQIKKGLKIHFPSLHATGIKIGESTELQEDAVDQLASALYKCKKKNTPMYKQIHKLLMKDNEADAKKGLEMMKKFKATMSESNYTIKNNKVLITKVNYDKKHKDYKSGKKGSETLLVLDPKSGGTVSMPVEFIKESDSKEEQKNTQLKKGKLTKDYRHGSKTFKKGMKVTVHGYDDTGLYMMKTPDNKKIYGYEKDDFVFESVELEEKLSVKDGMGAWISDFKKSDAPQFDDKSDKERRDMAIAAFMSAKNESVTEGLDMYASASEWVDTYNDLMSNDEKTQEEISDYILARRRQIRRTETTGGNNDEY